MNAIAGVVILYYPDRDIIKNVHSYCTSLKKLYVFDNSEQSNEQLATELGNIPNAAYFHDGENKGIATRLNQAARSALEEGIYWLLTMDQDSYFSTENIQAYLHCFAQYRNSSAVAVFGVEYEKPPSAGSGCEATELNRLITSGGLVNLPVWSRLGGFDELLFIDEVDPEYCYRAIVAGCKVVKFNNVYLQHSLGRISYHKSLKSFNTTPRTLHSPLRVYYMVRNHLYVRKKYKAYFKEDISTSRSSLANRIKNNFLYGKDRWLLLKMIFQAMADFRNGRMGKKPG